MENCEEGCKWRFTFDSFTGMQFQGKPECKRWETSWINAVEYKRMKYCMYCGKKLLKEEA